MMLTARNNKHCDTIMALNGTEVMVSIWHCGARWYYKLVLRCVER